MAKDFARAFYDSKAWRTTRKAFMIDRCYICERCGGVARIVHHKKHVTPWNIGNASITLDWENLESLCMDCHNVEHMGSTACANGLTFDAAGNLTQTVNCRQTDGSYETA